jgi:hypothetical protein
MVEEGGLHLPDLHPVAAHLDLEVVAAEVRERAVGEKASEIARAIDAPGAAVGIGEEGRRREIGPLPVAGGEVLAPHRDLADLAGPGRPAARVEEQRLRALHGEAHRHDGPDDAGSAIDAQLLEGARLGRAEPVHEHAVVGKVTAERRDVPREEGLAREVHDAEVGECLVAREDVHEMTEEGRHGVIEGDALLAKPAGQDLDSLAPHVERDEGRSREEGAEEVHAAGAERADAVPGADAEPVVTDHPGEDHAVATHDALGHAGGAGRVEHAGDVVGTEPDPGVVRREIGRERVEPEHLDTALGRRGGGQVGDEERRLGIGQDAHLAVGRAGELEGDVGLAGLEATEDADREGDAVLEEQTDGWRGTGPVQDDPREPVRRRVELTVGERPLARLHRRPIGVASGHGVELRGEGCAEHREPPSGRLAARSASRPLSHYNDAT